MRPVRPAGTDPKIGLQTAGGLVALLRGLCQELHDDRRQRFRQSLRFFARRKRLVCDVAVDPLHRIRSRERQCARQHLVKRDAQRVEITSGVYGAVHPSGLLRRHVREGARDHFRRLRVLVLAQYAGRDAKAG